MASIITAEFRASYPNVFVPKLNKLSGKEEYNLVALFPEKANLDNLKAATKEAIEKKWGPDPKKWPKKLRSPFRDQAEREKELEDGTKVMPDGHVKGAIFLNLKSSRMPGIIDKDRKPILDAEEFYAGCWARASVSCYAYDTAGNQGVSFGLTNLQKVRDGEPLSGRPKAEDEFAAIEGADSSEVDDPFAS